MPIINVNKDSGVVKASNTRDLIIGFEGVLKNTEGVYIGDNKMCPLKHSFSEGIYVREIFIPKGTFIAGKIHKHEHPNFLMSGIVKVITEGKGEELLTGPLSIISEPGTKRALYSITDLVWITVHANPTNTQDLAELEKTVIADSFSDYKKYLRAKKSIGHKIKNLLIKTLSK